MPRKSGRRSHHHADKEKKLERHIKQLGLKSEDEYRQWCVEHGISRNLNKNPQQRMKEQELATRLNGAAALTQRRRGTRHPQNTISRLYRHEVEKDELGAAYLEKIHALFHQMEKIPDTRRAFHDLLVHVERFGTVFGMEPGIPFFGPAPGNTFIEAIGMLARRHDAWIRPADEWRPDSKNPRRQFSGLARHLLARYDIPYFMDAAWFHEVPATANQQQGWFLHMGSGKNIRTGDVPVTLTKKMAHRFATAPDDLPIGRALRWGQIVGQGGSESLARAMMSSRLGTAFDHEPFWETIIKFFVNNPMLDPSLVGPIIDFIQAQKFEPTEVLQPGGGVTLAEPAQPNFAIKGRSVDKLLQQMEEWHVALGGVAPGGGGGTELIQWDPSGLRPLRVHEEDPQTREKTTWTLQELLSNRELTIEGREMHHCVSSYAKNCRKSATTIWSLQAVDGNRERNHIMTIAVDARTRNVTQVRGKYNIAPVGKAKNVGQRSLNRGYMRLLSRSRRIFDRWVSQEGLRVRC